MTASARKNERSRAIRAFFADAPARPMTEHTNGDGGSHAAPSR
jgi:hypothetical protein